MKIYSWNVNGIRAVFRKGELQKFIAKHNPDILCLQETKAEQGQAEIDVPDYVECWNSAIKKGYSGTAIFTKQKPLQIINGFSARITKKYDLVDGYGDPNNEGRVITAGFENFFVISVYTPNSKGDLSRLKLRHKHWDPAFLEHIKELEAEKPVIFCGDLNVAHQEIDLARPKENVGKHGFTDEEREGFDNLIKAGFVDTFRLKHPNQKEAYTWWTHWANARTRNVGWRIDYIMVSGNLTDKVESAKIHPDQIGSDHCPVSIDITIDKQ